MLCLSQCGFQSSWQPVTTLPLPLRHLQLESSDPYSRFTQTIAHHLSVYGIHVYQQPPPQSKAFSRLTLHILHAAITRRLSILTPQLNARQFILVAEVAFTIEDKNHHMIVPVQHFIAQRQFMVAAEQPLELTAAWHTTSDTLRAELAERIVNYLHNPKLLQACYQQQAYQAHPASVTTHHHPLKLNSPRPARQHSNALGTHHEN